MEKLKPCPFCGGDATTHYGIHDYNRWGVYCIDCGAEIECRAFLGEEDTEAKAIEIWNTRV